MHGHTNGKPSHFALDLLQTNINPLQNSLREERVPIRYSLSFSGPLASAERSAHAWVCPFESRRQYAFASRAQLAGLNPAEALIQLAPKEGDFVLHTSDILEAIRVHGDSIAVIIFSGVQYYTGQLFDMQAITKAGHAKVSKQVISGGCHGYCLQLDHHS